MGEVQAQNENKMTKLLDRLLAYYSSYFDIYRDKDLLGSRIPALAEFHSRTEKYILVKKANIWAMESHEYLFFFLEPDLTDIRLLEISSLLIRAEKELVKPHSEHMYTYISGIILTEGIHELLPALIRKIKFRKSYKFSIHGWCQLRLTVMDVAYSRVWANRDGKELKKSLRKLLK